jgi:beta-N-acetylhexosaminidase
MATAAFICGCVGLELSADESRFIRESQPWGLILFKRNVADKAQLRGLTARFRDLVGRPDAPVLIDQEGGRVQRMGPPHWQAYPTAATFDRLPIDLDAKRALVRLTAQLIAHDLAEVGITIDCLPVLDIPIPGGHSVIGNRAFAQDPVRVGLLGRSAAEGLMAGGVLPTIKHIPGHGRALADSHHAVPIVSVPQTELEASDFIPFQMLSDMPMALTAHVVFQALDAERPATQSKAVIDKIIRHQLGFTGLLISDDVSMQALSGTLRGRAEAAFRAGVEVCLHCNGNLAEAAGVAAAAPLLAGTALQRAQAALARVPRLVEPLDLVEGRAKLAAALAVSA